MAIMKELILFFGILKCINSTIIVDTQNALNLNDTLTLSVNKVLRSDEITLCIMYKYSKSIEVAYLLHDDLTTLGYLELELKPYLDYGFFRWNHKRYSSIISPLDGEN